MKETFFKYWDSNLSKIFTGYTYGINLKTQGHVFLELLCSQSLVSNQPTNQPTYLYFIIINFRGPGQSLC